MSLNLRDLGHELDSIRRSRWASGGDKEETAPLVATAASAAILPDIMDAPSPDSSPGPSPPSAPHALPQPAPESPGAPACLLCLTRAPSAVLLPCCHMNLCYLCAPLLMHRGAEAARAAARARDDEAEVMASYAANSGGGGRNDVAETAAAPRRVPFNVALSRAVKSHPAARRLSLGGYVGPRTGRRGGELRGCDVVPPAPGRGAGAGADTDADADVGVARVRDPDGRVLLARAGEDTGTACPVCRAGVSAWLRVYT